MKKLIPVFISMVVILFIGTVFAQESVPGTALEFDGTNDYVEVGTSGSLSIADEMTIEAWIKVPSSIPDGPRVGTIFGNYPHSPHFNLEGHFYGRLRFYWNAGEIDIFSADFDMRDDTWHHVAVTRDYAVNQIILYIDGQTNGIFPAGSNIDLQWPFCMGKDFRSDPSYIFFEGIIEEVRLWNVARTTEEIRENMHLTLTGSEPGLVSYWQFNEASGSTTYDPVGGQDGTLYNMTAEDWVTSTVPAGGGSSYTQIVSATGVADFTETGLTMDFTDKAGTDTIVVSKLDLEPNIYPGITLADAFNSQYWIVNKFGSGTFTADLTFTPNETITPEDETSPGGLQLFNRTSNSELDWTNLMGASAASSAANTATFTGLSDFSQFLMGRQWFTDINAGLIGVYFSSVAWGDYDNDGDLDILLCGKDSSFNYISRIYRNDPSAGSGRVFTDINGGLTGVNFSSVAWGDYDNDGDLDILLTGRDASNNFISRIYRNDPSAGSGTDRVFTDINAGLTGVNGGSIAWGDYDNDGDLDILLTGYTGSERISSIYRNDPWAGSGTDRVFTDINAGLIGVDDGSVAWGDYDNDGDLDILLTGYTGSERISRIYRNNGDDSFTNINTGLPGLTGVDNSSVAWGDYDNDGDLDILLTGEAESYDIISRIYRNNGPSAGSGWTFTDIGAGLTDVYEGSVAWGDYDNDGDLDILITGAIGYFPNYNPISRIYRNNGNDTFTDIEAGLIGVYYSSVAWGDYDNDGDLDILLTGRPTAGGMISRIYCINNIVSNTAPLSPDGLNKVVSTDSIAFSWNMASDNETASEGLTYNLFLGNSTYDLFLKPPMADASSGYRNIPAIGNVCKVTEWSYKIETGLFSYPQVILPDYWGVQAIDHAFAGSDFATDNLITIPITYLQLSNDAIMYPTDTLTWEYIYGDSVVSFIVQVDDDPNFSSCEVNDTLSVTLAGTGNYSIVLQDLEESENLVDVTEYYWRIKPVYTFSLPTVFSETPSQFHYVEILISGLAPEDDATGFHPDSSLVITFNYPVIAGNGNIEIMVSGVDTLFETIPAANTTINGNMVTIDPANSFDMQTGYYVLIDNTAFLDGSGHYFAGIQDADTWNFTTLKYFTDINTGLPEVSFSSVAWGDYDNDGDLDILLTGHAGSSGISSIYRNNGNGSFTGISTGLTAVINGSVAWGDYDNDGDLDILLTGDGGEEGLISRIYLNNGDDSFTGIVAGLTGAGLIGVSRGSVAWGDYDNDGDLDILLTGEDESYNGVSRIYRNNGNSAGSGWTFTDINAGLTSVWRGSVAWGDYDNDGDLDILLTGEDESYNGVSRIYRNNGNDTFTDIEAGLTGVWRGSVAWGDYDNDGDLDILMTGYYYDGSYHYISSVYRNNGDDSFTDIGAGLTGVRMGSVAWGDYDNDGNLDILLTGWDESFNRISIIYRNDPSGAVREFTDINAGLPGVETSSVVWGDYDNDGDLDILLTGSSTSNLVSRIYRNNSLVSNTDPLPPDGLNEVVSTDSIAFSWNMASDNETASEGLTYNLFLGNSTYDLFLKPPMANTGSGYRNIPAIGNVCKVTEWSYKIETGFFSYPQVLVPDHWGIQTIDHAFAGSSFSVNSLSFSMSYLQTISHEIMQITDSLSWLIQAGDSVISYQVQIDDDSTFTNCEVNDVLYVSVSGSGYYSISLQDLRGSDMLIEGTKYYWRIKPNYTFGLPTIFTDPPPSFWFGYMTDIEDETAVTIPKKFALQQNYPNPFNPTTTICYQLSAVSRVDLSIYNALGQKVTTLVSENQPAGYYTVEWNAAGFASGVYYYRFQAGNFLDMKKMILIK